MKFIRILFLLCSLTLPTSIKCKHIHYKTLERPASNHYYSAYCYCNHCYPNYGYYCPYCYDANIDCPECNKTVAQIFLVGILIATTAYLLDQALKS